MSITNTLRQAAKVQEKIDVLRGQFAGLIVKARLELAASPVEEIPALPAPRVAAKNAERTKENRGCLEADPPFTARRTQAGCITLGAAGPAVVKVLRSKGKPMNVQSILTGLTANGYKFNAAEPKKNLAARIYRLSGVKQVGPGLFHVV